MLIDFRNMAYLKTLFALACIVLSPGLFSQMSPERTLKKIDTSHYEIIFPESYEKNAHRIAKILDQYYQFEKYYLGFFETTKLSIILNNKTAYSNGFVTLAPHYSMFYTLAPQINTYSLFYDDWMENLAVHELRHASQFAKLKTGFNKVLYDIFGDAGLAAGMGLSAPAWFFEGDAVYMETALTGFGRGRMPSFSLLTRSILLEEKIPQYSQSFLNSNLQIYPNIYETGYLLTSYIRRNFGNEIFDDILKYSSTWNFIAGPYAFAMAVYTITGKSLYLIYDEMMAELKANWQLHAKNETYTSPEILNNPKKQWFTSYSNPCPANGDNTVYVYKRGKFNAGSVVGLLPGKEEQFLFFTDTLTGSIGVSGNLIVWSEEEPDLRWDDSKSIIKVYNISNKKTKTLDFDGRIFSPSLSSDQRMIAGINSEINGDNSLVLINLESGKIVEKVPAPESTLWQTPRWGNTSDKIAIVESTKEGKSLIIFSPGDRKIFRFMKPIRHQISDPFIHGDVVYFHSDYSGTDNIHAVKIGSEIIYMVTNVKLGAFQPGVSKDGKYVYFGNFSRMGIDAARIPNQSDWPQAKESSALAPEFVSYSYSNQQLADEISKVQKSLPANDYEIKDYSEFANFINFHSRYIDPTSFLSLGQIGIGIISSNKLQTHFLGLHYTYHAIEDGHSINADWTFKGWYPVITIGGYYGSKNDLVFEQGSTLLYRTWNDQGLYSQIYVPLNFSTGFLHHKFTGGTDISWAAISNFRTNGIPEEHNNYSGMMNMYAVSYSLGADGNPRLFDHPYFNLALYLNITPQLGLLNENRDSKEGSFLLEIPGFFNANKIIARVAASARSNAQDDLFSSRVIYPRGTSFHSYENLYMLSADYFMPLFYPDLDFLHVLYIKQFNLDLFYEQLWVELSGLRVSNYIGADLTMVFNIFELRYDLELGMRFIYFLTDHRMLVTPVMNIQINYNF